MEDGWVTDGVEDRYERVIGFRRGALEMGGGEQEEVEGSVGRWGLS